MTYVDPVTILSWGGSAFMLAGAFRVATILFAIDDLTSEEWKRRLAEFGIFVAAGAALALFAFILSGIS